MRQGCYFRANFFATSFFCSSLTLMSASNAAGIDLPWPRAKCAAMFRLQWNTPGFGAHSGHFTGRLVHGALSLTFAAGPIANLTRPTSLHLILGCLFSSHMAQPAS